MNILYHTYFQKSYTICTKMNFIYLQIGGGKSIIIYKRKRGKNPELRHPSSHYLHKIKPPGFIRAAEA